MVAGVSLHRKAFRLGKFAEEYKKFKETLEKAKEDVKKTLNLLLSAAMGLFYLHDNLIWAVDLKVLNGDKNALKRRAAYCRTFAAVTSLILCVMSISETQEKLLASAEGSKDRVKVEEKQGKNTVDLVKNVADVLCYSNSANFIEMIKGSGYDDGTLGLLGSISALCGGYSQWLKM